jgi:M6 family metalloprotease-like protein
VVLVLAAACGAGGHDGAGDGMDGGGIGGDAGSGSGGTNPVTACRLPGTQYGVRLGFPRIANRAPNTGNVHIKVLFVDFSDAVATRTPQQVMGILSPRAEQFYAAVSAGRMNLIFDPVYTWLRMSKPTTGYPWSPLTFDGQKAYIEEAVQLAGNLDVSTTDAVIVITNPDVTAFAYGPAFTANAGDGYTIGSKTFDNGATSGNDMTYWGSGWFNHEFGHAMGLVDLYEVGVANPQTFHFTGDFSMMGNILGKAPEYLGWERWVLGWIDDDAVLCTQPGQTTATLTPIEVAGGNKIAVVPTGATTALVVESRRAMGYDHALDHEGLLVYSIDTSISTGSGVIKVLPIDNNDDVKTSALIGVGGSLTQGNVTITHVAQDAAGDHLTISY